MPEKSVESVDARRKKITFHKTKRMSTYLLAFCIGEYDSIQANLEAENGEQTGVTVRVRLIVYRRRIKNHIRY